MKGSSIPSKTVIHLKINPTRLKKESLIGSSNNIALNLQSILFSITPSDSHSIRKKLNQSHRCWDTFTRLYFITSLRSITSTELFKHQCIVGQGYQSKNRVSSRKDNFYGILASPQPQEKKIKHGNFSRIFQTKKRESKSLYLFPLSPAMLIIYGSKKVFVALIR